MNQRITQALLEKHGNVKLNVLQKIYRYIFHNGQRICEVCGWWVSDVEVPVHATRSGASFVHPIHIITSEKGRKLIDSMARMPKEELELRAEGVGARYI